MNESSATGCLVSKVNIEGIPIILIENLITAVKPIVFIFHKLLMRKEDQLPLGYNLASRGFFLCSNGYAWPRRAGNKL